MKHSQHNNLQSLLHQGNTKSRRSIFLFFFFFQLGKLNSYRSVNISTNLFLFFFVLFFSTDGIAPVLSSKPHLTNNFCSLWRRANARNFRLVIVLPWQFQPRQLVSVDHVFVFHFRYWWGTTVSLETKSFFAVCDEPDNGFVFLVVVDQCKFFADYRDREQVASRGGTPLLQSQGNWRQFE